MNVILLHQQISNIHFFNKNKFVLNKLFRDEFKSERPTTDIIYYRPPSTLNEKEIYYMGLTNELESLTTWSREKCIPLVREITFSNAEELTDEGLPFLILFHKADDQESIVLFEHEVAKQLANERCNYLFHFF